MSMRANSARRLSRKAWLILLAGLALGAGILWRWAETTAYAANFVVNTTADSDDGVCSSAASGCTLREAINAANANAGEDTINFNIPGPGVHTIQLKSNLPTLNGRVTIDGYSQPGASPNTLAQGNNATLLIELVGGYSEGPCCQETGLRLVGGANNVRGLVVNRFIGTGISIQGGTETTIQGNFIGTHPTGTVAFGNNVGLSINDAKDVLVGGIQPADRNVISGNHDEGIQTLGGELTVSSGIENNYIGTALDGQTPLGNGRGIFLLQSSHHDIRSNTIAFNKRQGILVVKPGADNTFLSNSIHSNGGLGIDLGGGTEDSFGVTPNDAGDADAGPNSLQNFPVITSATVSGGTATITGTLNSTPNTFFTVQIYSNRSCDPSGHGEGERAATTLPTMMTDASGNVSFTINSLTANHAGPFFTATATVAGNTSEFSPCVAALAGTFVVNTSADTDDGLCNVANCTLREAINAANGNPSLNAINFNIPGGGVRTISPTSPLPTITSPVIIDGYTQPGASPNTLADGNNAVLLIELNGAGAGGGVGLALQGGSSVVRGLVINRFSLGTGIVISMDGGNVVAGNFIGTDQSGASSAANVVGVAVVGSEDNRIGGLSPGDRNVISGNSHHGVDLVSSSRANVVQGNFIGTTKTGTAALGNNLEGVRMGDSGFNLIGGTSAAARNVISGNKGNGVMTLAGTSSNVVQRNFIGTDVSGNNALGNSKDGISLFGAGFLVGGSFTDEGNIIAFNGGDGITVGLLVGNFISHNSIHSNGGLGIDLEGGTENSFGVTANDPGDLDAGPNRLQNFPVLQFATTSGSTTTVHGTLSSTPNKVFRISYYSSPSCDPSGNGEGHKPFFEDRISTGAGGSVGFSTSFSNLSFSGPFITATATDPDGNTSEFSPCVEAPPNSNFQFGEPSVSVFEDCTEVVFTVSRVGVTSGVGAVPANVEYATQPGTASDRSDFNAARGTLRFAVGETAKTIRVLVSEDSRVEGTETATVTLFNPTSAGLGNPATATLEILDDPPEQTVNPTDVAEQFVGQHYHDFLNRQHDVEGLNFWTNEIEKCGADAQCREIRRINVSAAFFFSIEFEQTGFFAIRVQRAAFGRRSDSAATRVTFNLFLADSRELGEDVIVGTPGWEQEIEARRQAYAERAVNSAEFVAKYPLALSAEQFVDALFSTATITPTAGERQEALTAFGAGGTAGRVAALRRVADSDSLRTAEFRPAFVLMQYFGYLRRDPDEQGFQFWLAKLNQFGGDFVRAEMVKAFISSIEYRGRFGQP